MAAAEVPVPGLATTPICIPFGEAVPLVAAAGDAGPGLGKDKVKKKIE